MSTATPDDPSSAEDKAAQTRLDKEIEEILARSGAEQLKAPRRAPMPPNLRSMPSGLSTRRSGVSRRLSSPGILMISSLGVALIAVLVADASPLLARLLVFAAVGMFLAPVLMRLRPSTSAPEQKMWRGQTMEFTPERPGMADQARRWWQDRTRR